jgi:glucosamine-6-phosphate deaminase
MNIILVNNYEEMSLKAAEIVLGEIKRNPSLVMCFPTGSTPLGMYSILSKSKVDFSGIITFNLDEYYPMKKKDKNSYYSYMHENLFNQINIQKKNINLLNSEAKDSEKECKRYENIFRKFKVDLQILGLGANGHIGFNEPKTSFDSITRVIKLSKETREANSRLFSSVEKVPKHAMTLGIKNILSSKKIIMLVSGKNKSQAARNMLEKEISEDYPATILKKHKDVTVIIDKSQVRV